MGSQLFIGHLTQKAHKKVKDLPLGLYPLSARYSGLLDFIYSQEIDLQDPRDFESDCKSPAITTEKNIWKIFCGTNLILSLLWNSISHSLTEVSSAYAIQPYLCCISSQFFLCFLLIHLINTHSLSRRLPSWTSGMPDISSFISLCLTVSLTHSLSSALCSVSSTSSFLIFHSSNQYSFSTTSLLTARLTHSYSLDKFLFKEKKVKKRIGQCQCKINFNSVRTTRSIDLTNFFLGTNRQNEGNGSLVFLHTGITGQDGCHGRLGPQNQGGISLCRATMHDLYRLAVPANPLRCAALYGQVTNEQRCKLFRCVINGLNLSLYSSTKRSDCSLAKGRRNWALEKWLRPAASQIIRRKDDGIICNCEQRGCGKLKKNKDEATGGNVREEEGDRHTLRDQELRRGRCSQKYCRGGVSEQPNLEEDICKLKRPTA
ncbi:hypothetical protein VP01_2401g2 [Puccinia sorghi]|uniref:Uncharacterized protein n=1 Tax=Puccinia sorghi TaxID=27349 RepID=A0A0L6V6R3_9BASI|nr:hypothetical protein VP01_2401g2 [Puccinia sorghi]